MGASRGYSSSSAAEVFERKSPRSLGSGLPAEGGRRRGGSRSRRRGSGANPVGRYITGRARIRLPARRVAEGERGRARASEGQRPSAAAIREGIGARRGARGGGGEERRLIGNQARAKERSYLLLPSAGMRRGALDVRLIAAHRSRPDRWCVPPLAEISEGAHPRAEESAEAVRRVGQAPLARTRLLRS
ncbi:hypothetical protein KM043_012311 [Ampulex compressa]|nr:hypothetical protein KM043_012311 [Ampulex compressa]